MNRQYQNAVYESVFLFNDIHHTEYNLHPLVCEIQMLLFVDNAIICTTIIMQSVAHIDILSACFITFLSLWLTNTCCVLPNFANSCLLSPL